MMVLFFCHLLYFAQIRDIFEAAGLLKTNYRKTMDITLWYMQSLNLPKTLQNRVRMWFNYNWDQQKTLGELMCEIVFFRQNIHEYFVQTICLVRWRRAGKLGRRWIRCTRYEKMVEVSELCNVKKITRTLVIITFLSDENSLIESLPRKMKTDLAIHVHFNTLSKVQLFQVNNWSWSIS